MITCSLNGKQYIVEFADKDVSFFSVSGGRNFTFSKIHKIKIIKEMLQRLDS